MKTSLRLQARAVLGVALGLRLLVLWGIVVKYPKDWLYTRGMEMGLLARSLLAGDGLSSPFGGATGPTAFIAPGYPLFVAGIFKLFGVYSFGSALMIMLLQIAINLLAIWWVMTIADELFDRRTALVAGWVWTCSPALLFLPTIFWDTSISVCALLGVMKLALRIRRQPSMGLWVLLGICCGVTGLINPALILVLAGIIGWAAWETRGRSRYGAGVAVVVAMAVFSPWPIRNARVFHAFVPLRTTVGFELWMGNHPGSTGFLDESLFPTFNKQELTDYNRMGEIAYTRHKSELATSYIVEYPGRFAELTLRRIFRFWTGTGTQNGSWLFIIHATVTSLLGLVGLVGLIRKGRVSVAALFLVPVLLFPVPYYLTHAEFRYRLAIDPEMTILAAYAVVWLFGRRAASAVLTTNAEILASPE